MTATREELIAHAQAHAAVLATLEDDPRYELQPVGLIFRGHEALLRPLLLGVPAARGRVRVAW